MFTAAQVFIGKLAPSDAPLEISEKVIKFRWFSLPQTVVHIRWIWDIIYDKLAQHEHDHNLAPRASTTILRELCLNRLYSNKSFFSLAQKRAGRSGCQPFNNSSLPSARSWLLAQTAKEVTDSCLSFAMMSNNETQTKLLTLTTLFSDTLYKKGSF